MLSVNKYSISSGGHHYLIDENNVGPDYVKGLRPEDFEQFVNDLKACMEQLRRSIDAQNGPFGSLSGFYGRIWVSGTGDTMPKVIVVHDAETASYDIKFEYKGNTAWDAVTGVVAVIKATIPVSDRAYDPNTRIWSVAEKYWPSLKELLQHSTFQIDESKKLKLEDFFYEAPAPAVPTRDSLGNSICKLLGVTSDVLSDSAALKKAYRKKALELHPDRNNGDGSKMSELNSIWSQYNA
jgi:DnaJ domain